MKDDSKRFWRELLNGTCLRKEKALVKAIALCIYLVVDFRRQQWNRGVR